jgi:hypothetical protein
MAATSPPQVHTSTSNSTSIKPFWNRMLSAWKVKRILEARGFDAEAFRRDYEADTHRGPRRPGRPPEREINAVDDFLKSGDYQGFMNSLGTDSRPKADSALRRVVEWKGQDGLKAVRKRASAGRSD